MTKAAFKTNVNTIPKKFKLEEQLAPNIFSISTNVNSIHDI